MCLKYYNDNLFLNYKPTDTLSQTQGQFFNFFFTHTLKDQKKPVASDNLSNVNYMSKH